MKKAVIILSILFVFAALQAQEKQNKTKNNITIESFTGKWSLEFIGEDEMKNHSFELLLEKDGAKTNELKGWHCVIIRGGRKIDCDDYNEQAPIHGYLENDTVYLHFINNWGDEVEAKLYFDKSAQNLSNIIWELGRYEPKIQPFFLKKYTLQKVTVTQK